MIDFIVWDKKEKKFINENMAGEMVAEFGLCENEHIKVCLGIGLKDMNNNNIYADSSIAECDYYEDFKDKVTIRGYFKYDDKDLAYYFIFLNSNRGSELFINLDLQNIKIIDTIQEDKLGLFDIKEN